VIPIASATAKLKVLYSCLKPLNFDRLFRIARVFQIQNDDFPALITSLSQFFKKEQFMSEKATTQTDKAHTGEESSRHERDNLRKPEHSDSRILSTDSSNRTSNLIATNAVIAVGSRLQGQKSEIYVNDMCVKLSDKRFAFPNVVLVSGEPSFGDKKSDVLLNPTVVIEIFSKDTSFNDKTEKLECYLAMESIREYILVKEDEMRVDHYAKQNAKQWVYRIYNQRDDVVSIEAVNCKISVAEIYAQVKFGQADTKTQAAT